ncbi:MAG: hypothetical protein JW871_00105 [Endomicrobiales bacterium]|nr:hypothetical protein [Endomicrobiales bacterium]
MSDTFSAFWEKWEKQLSDLENRINDKKADRAEIREDSFRKSIDDAKAGTQKEVEKLKESLNRYLLEKQSMQSYLEMQGNEIGILQKEIDKTKTELKGQEKRYSIQRDNVDILIRNLGKQLVLTEQEKESIRDRYLQVEKNQKELNEEVKFLKADLKKQCNKTNELTNANDEIEKLAKEKENEISVLFIRLNKLEEERKKLTDEIRQLKLKDALKNGSRKHKYEGNIFKKVFKWLIKPLVNVDVEK